MKITHLTSATEIIEVNGIKILTDPWLDDGIYYGSWYLYPPYTLPDSTIADVDYVYVSHIHPDHFCDATMQRLNKSIPILIHRYQEPFLKRRIESMGFQVMELENNQRTLLQNDVHINIIAADNCNPEICGKAFGCFAFSNQTGGSNQIDSMCVIDNEEFVLLNTNDCPYPIAYESIGKVKQGYSKIDFLLVGYTGASLYPYAMVDYSEDEMHAAKDRARLKSLGFGARIIAETQPRFFMPFAGTYVLGGSNWELNRYSPSPELEDAVEYFETRPEIDSGATRPVLLNAGETFDLATESQSKPYEPINKNERWSYIESELSQKSYVFENDPPVSLLEFEEIIPKATDRMFRKREEIGFATDTRILISLPGEKLLKIDCRNDHASSEIVDDCEDEYVEPFIYFEVDFRLLYRILKGPRYAHWNNVEIAALLKMRRHPDTYEMGIHLLLCYLHQ